MPDTQLSDEARKKIEDYLGANNGRPPDDFPKFGTVRPWPRGTDSLKSH